MADKSIHPGYWHEGHYRADQPAAPETERLREALRQLRDHGYQPMYNGRPSCPFCSNFIDDEETHRLGCVLLSIEAGDGS